LGVLTVEMQLHVVGVLMGLLEGEEKDKMRLPA
jgi:hypothetical protein